MFALQNNPNDQEYSDNLKISTASSKNFLSQNKTEMQTMRTEQKNPIDQGYLVKLKISTASNKKFLLWKNTENANYALCVPNKTIQLIKNTCVS